MSGFIEFDLVCPKCKKETGVLDVGKTYQDSYCTNPECNFSKTIDF
tara:strand:- start:598 stop:735 length:138 start_codon:yes stop_codon:yes gene_type:complete